MWSTLPTRPTKPRTSAKETYGRTMAYAIGLSSLGHVLIALEGDIVRHVSLGQSPESLLSNLRALLPSAALRPSTPTASRHLAVLIAHIEDPSLPLPRWKMEQLGTPFQRTVWGIISTIPRGGVLTYAQVAERTGNPKAVRAVAGACGRNGLAVIVPCHRVVGSDGKMGGYRWGTEIKKQLLERERRVGEGNAADAA